MQSGRVGHLEGKSKRTRREFVDGLTCLAVVYLPLDLSRPSLFLYIYIEREGERKTEPAFEHNNILALENFVS
jgi:hypothetical protein